MRKKNAIRKMFVIAGRNLYTQNEEAAGHIYGVFATYNSALSALEDEVEQATHGPFASWVKEDIKWSKNKGYNAHGVLVEVFMGDEYTYQLIETNEF